MDNQSTEWEEIWKDDFLKTICAFANTEGGTLTVGINDDGKAIGAKDPEKLLKVIPDTIRDRLGIVPFVKLEIRDGKNVVSIRVERSPVSVTLDGRFYVRSGSTTQLVTGRELELYLLQRIGTSWTEEPINGISADDLSPEAILSFKKRGISSKRLTSSEASLSTEGILDKLNLYRDGMLKRSAILLFHPSPERYIPSATVKIGLFDGPRLLYHDELTGPMMIVADQAVNLIDTKYTISPVSYEGITRVESKPYPMAAVREAVMNAIVHNDYSSQAPIQIKVFPDRLTVYNSGGLPAGWTIDRLVGAHRSVPRNPSMANVFFRAGLIESFGRGIDMIMSQFNERDVTPPTFDCPDNEFSITFSNEANMFKTIVPEHADSQLQTVMGYLSIHGCGTYFQISKATGLSVRQIQRIIREPLDNGTIIKTKTGREVSLSLQSQ